MGEGGNPAADGQEEAKPAPGKKSPAAKLKSRKVLAIIIAVIVIGSGAFYVWFNYFRHWSTEDVAEMVINDPTPASPGFKHSLAGKKVIVEGEVTGIRSANTTLGPLSFVELDDFSEIELMFWGDIDYELGDRIEVPVRFEWSVCNEESHVYSPQIGFPCLQYLFSTQVAIDSVSYVLSYSSMYSVIDEGQGVRVSVDIMEEPVPLEIVNCTLKAGQHSYALEYVDLIGMYPQQPIIDEIVGLSTSSSTNGSIEFTDNNNDGYLDPGDFFIVDGLERPETDSGAYTYLMSLNCSRVPDMPYVAFADGQNAHLAGIYIIMTKNGVLRTDYYNPAPGITPPMKMMSSWVPFGQKMTLTAFTEGVPWSDVDIMIYDDSAVNSDILYPDSLDLTGPAPTTCEFDPFMLGSITVFCNITDKQGDGVANDGDDIILTTGGESQFDSSCTYSVILIHEPSSDQICREIVMYLAQPSSSLTKFGIASGLRFDFGTVHNGTDLDYEKMDVMWSEVSITLSDGTNNVTWVPSPEDLADGSLCTIAYDGADLGGITVFCNVTDLQGNGWINSGDNITLSTGSNATFLDSVTYTLTIVYEPTDGVMSEVEFQG